MPVFDLLTGGRNKSVGFDRLPASIAPEGRIGKRQAGTGNSLADLMQRESASDIAPNTAPLPGAVAVCRNDIR